ncbi:rod shape-determining protein MreC [Pseudaquabacterium pictum]|uniref:Cell shape-determining protein MreC n=1 Tax=Pseudaquabacterium pictum TaxID=2315236 RepID=A0A480AZ03_9BURK|nr:rod shape-determining protein MreC [Rubrivivax pictus]GCL66200.1 rod shape-determining protein MreC [Rubrivivax pictus]
MALGTIDRTPPPFFRQGPSALTKLALFSALAVFLMAADTRWHLTQPLRAALATALLPLQQTLQVPAVLLDNGLSYLQGIKDAQAREAAARQQLARQSERAARTEQLAAENERLRALLELQPQLQVRSVAAELLYEAGDPYSRKIFINRGARQGVVAGAPVVNEAGVLGQVTEVYPLSAVVTLLTDRDAAIPVLNTRTQQRGAAFGGAEGGSALELRFMAGNADVQAGDALTTSGVDGVYPPGLPVARVARVERRSDAGFARIVLTPMAAMDNLRHMLVLEPLAVQMPPRPADAAASAAGTAKSGSRASAAGRPGRPASGQELPR